MVTGDRHTLEGLELAAALWEVPFVGWGAPHRLRAADPCVPRRYVVLDRERGLTAASGYTSRPSLQAGEVFTLVIEEP